MSGRKRAFLIGSYAAPGMPGIMSAVLDEERGTLSVAPECCETENPSWLHMHPNGTALYAVEERERAGNIVQLEKDRNGWRLCQRQPVEDAPCHISMDERQAYLFVSNYFSGSLSVFRLGGDGAILEQTALIRHTGHGVDSVRQEGPHVHSTLCMDDLVYTADLGLDAVFVYRLNRSEGTLEAVGRIALEPGAGPRHMVRVPGHPELLYVVGELSGNIYRLDRKACICLNSQRIIPEDELREVRASAVKTTGDTVYIGCRERNAVVQFTVCPDGSLGMRSVHSHSGKTPRDVFMDRNWAITADQDSFGLTLFRRTGMELTPVCFCETPGIRPSCIVPLEEQA
ncbi:MAG: lactonase family protein [Clostridia bacterium]|nr:lactonase family protein [Clostridia bacterium]